MFPRQIPDATGYYQQISDLKCDCLKILKKVLIFSNVINLFASTVNVHHASLMQAWELEESFGSLSLSTVLLLCILATKSSM